MVAEITNHTTTYIWTMMSYADALDYRTIWFEKHNVPYRRFSDTSALTKVIT